MSSPYAVLGNRPLDQWKVTELKEELKKRKLAVKGLKEDLVKRLDEAVRLEQADSPSEDTDNVTDQSELPSEGVVAEPLASENAKDVIDEVDDQRGVLGQDNDVKADLVQGQEVILEQEQDAQNAGVESTEVIIETTESVITSSETHIHSDGTDIAGSTVGLENDSLNAQEGSKVESSDPSAELPHENSIPALSPPTDSSHLQSDQDNKQVKHQVSKVELDSGFQVVSDSVSTESVSIIEKNGLKVDVIADNVKLEVDIKHEKLQTSIKSVATDGGESHQMDVEEPLNEKDVKMPLVKENTDRTVELKVSVDETSGNDHEVGDLDPREKLSLDRSSGDDSMEEDVLDIKQVESKSNSSESIGDVGKSEAPTLKEENDVDVVGLDKPVENAGYMTANVLTSGKRKFDKEVVVNKETTKKPRRWNVESPKVSEPQGGNIMASTTHKESPNPTSNRFTRSDSTLKEEAPKERVVPPSSKSPSNSLRIDRFVRPFTLKAVQELLGKTGTVSSFWMDHIKTHCYVSYSSVEEAVETRNAVYNLQWPPNGGRMLIADFVDAKEVKNRLEAPLPSPATTPSAQPSPRVQDLRQQIPQHHLPLPPPLANPPTPRERGVENQPLPARDRIVNLPPVVPEKVETPIVTLDDLFKKTKAMPRIYYLPLSDEQVAEKVKSQGNVN